jgi:hypothetical protein
MTSEMEFTEERLRRVKEQSKSLADTALALKEIADKLRADVDALTERVDVVEHGNNKVAKNLVKAADVVEKQQLKQDGRLDTLES